MPYTPPTSGSSNWDVTLNAALSDINDDVVAAQADADSATTAAAAAQQDVDDALAGGGASVATSQDQTGTSYGDLATVGPSVTVTLAEARTAIIFMKVDMSNATTADDVWVSYAVSGATTIAANDARALRHNGSGGVQSYTAFETASLSAGANTIKLQYRVDGGTGRYVNRQIAVIVT
jgi:hypothetical protein